MPKKEKAKMQKDKRLKEFGEYLSTLRKTKKVSVNIAAKAAGISSPYLYQVEYGKKALSDPVSFQKIASFYEVPVDDLLKKAGYLPESENEETTLEKKFVHAISDPLFNFGTRLRGKVDMDVKKFVVEMYEKLKEKK